MKKRIAWLLLLSLLAARGAMALDTECKTILEQSDSLPQLLDVIIQNFQIQLDALD